MDWCEMPDCSGVRGIKLHVLQCFKNQCDVGRNSTSSPHPLVISLTAHLSVFLSPEMCGKGVCWCEVYELCNIDHSQLTWCCEGITVQRTHFSIVLTNWMPLNMIALIGCCTFLQNVGPMNMVYSLSLTFGLLVLPEYAPFSLPALVQASHKDFCKYEHVKGTEQWLVGWTWSDLLYFCTAMLTMDGVCNDEHFYITIEHRNQGIPFHVKVGKRTLTADLYAAYGVKENATHMTMAVPFLAQDVVFEVQR